MPGPEVCPVEGGRDGKEHTRSTTANFFPAPASAFAVDIHLLLRPRFSPDLALERAHVIRVSFL